MEAFGDVLDEVSKKARANLYPSVPVVASIGHSIVLGQDGKLVLSGIAQPIEFTGEKFPDGSLKFIRTGVRRRVDPERLYASDKAIFGGGQLMIQALAYFLTEMFRQNIPPKTVVYSGGRPGYLRSTPKSVNEARFMNEGLEARVDDKILSEIEQVIESDGLRTKDDVEKILAAALARKCDSVALVAFGIRIPRCVQAEKELKIERSDLRGIEMCYIPVELVMSHEDGWGKYWSKVIKSKPYKKTRADEENGYNAAISGSYGGTGST